LNLLQQPSVIRNSLCIYPNLCQILTPNTIVDGGQLLNFGFTEWRIICPILMSSSWLASGTRIHCELLGFAISQRLSIICKMIYEPLASKLILINSHTHDCFGCWSVRLDFRSCGKLKRKFQQLHLNFHLAFCSSEAFFNICQNKTNNSPPYFLYALLKRTLLLVAFYFLFLDSM